MHTLHREEAPDTNLLVRPIPGGQLYPFEYLAGAGGSSENGGSRVTR
jgi:single-stranded DNA-specific DHH superfamily exonuclease